MLLQIPRLRRLIKRRYQCNAEHVRSKIVVERAPDGSLWRGTVEVFDLSGHPEANRCYGWVEEANGECIWHTWLNVPPVGSAEAAVRAMLAERNLPADTFR